MMPDFGGLIARLALALRAADIPFMLIGGQAVLVHGEPRLTQDIDVTLGVPPEQFSRILGVCASCGLGPIPEDPEAFVSETFVLPASDASTGIRVDFVFSTSEYERLALERTVPVEVRGTSVPFASAEDLVLHKVFAGRPRDLEDAAGVVRRQGASLDWPYLRQWGEEFAQVPGREDVPDELRRLHRIV